MTEPAYLVLLALSDGPRHGYGIVQEVLGLSDGAVRLSAGTLYGVLDRLTTAGQVEPERDEVVDGRLRRYYKITDRGSAAAHAETERLTALARRAHEALAPRRTPASRPTTATRPAPATRLAPVTRPALGHA